MALKTNGVSLDYSLCLVTDRAILGGASLQEAVAEAIRGGVTLVQLREKDIASREFCAIAQEIKEVADYYRVPLIINDRIDIALAVDAAGVHLGQNDLDVRTARRILGRRKIIGISVENKDEALAAQEGSADYLGVGAVFYTGSKADINTPIGLSGLQEICRAARIPKIAIGGINAGNIASVMDSGADGAAVISAILGRPDIREAARGLKDSMRK